MPDTGQIWNEFSEPLRAFIRRRTRDDAVTDDLLQEVFVRIHGRIDSLDNEDRLAAWLYRLTRNVVIDHHRRSGVARYEALGEDADRAESPTDGNLNEQVASWLSGLIARLPEPYREAVELAEIEGVPQVEIASRLDLSVSGAKSRVQRGRRMLQEMLLSCCHFQLDRRGNVIGYERVQSCAACCEPGRK